MTIGAIMLNRIDEIGDEIASLRDRFRESKYPERGDLRKEIGELMAEREQLRKFRDKLKTKETDFIDVSCPKCGNRFTAGYVVLDKPTTRYIKCPRCNMMIEVMI